MNANGTDRRRGALAELNAMERVAAALDGLSDADARGRVLQWAQGHFSESGEKITAAAARAIDEDFDFGPVEELDALSMRNARRFATQAEDDEPMAAVAQPVSRSGRGSVEAWLEAVSL
jgi:hypothetical protein